MLRNKETGRQRYWRQVREIADEEDISPSEAREKWRNYYKPGGIRRIVLALNAVTHHVSSVCPYCRDNLLEEEIIYSCPGCKTRYHQECIDEFGQKCATLGCRGARQNRLTVRERPTRQREQQGRFPLIPITIAIISVILIILSILFLI
jgi:hypothetical protein